MVFLLRRHFGAERCFAVRVQLGAFFTSTLKELIAALRLQLIPARFDFGAAWRGDAPLLFLGG